MTKYGTEERASLISPVPAQSLRLTTPLAVSLLALCHRHEADHAFEGVRNTARHRIGNEADDDHRARLRVQLDPLRRAHRLDRRIHGERKQCLIKHVRAWSGAR